MKKFMAAAVMVVAMMAAVSVVKAQAIYSDWTESLVTNYNATVTSGTDTNTSTLVLPAATGASYSRIDIVPATNVCFAFGRAATTNDVQITTAGYSFKILSVIGGPYRRDAIYLRDTRGATNLTTTATVTAWQIIKN